MDFDFSVKLFSEFIGTALLLILGNGAVANVELKGTKGHQSGWLVIAIGYGMGVMMPALMFGNVSGNHINPAFTLGLAVSGLFPWANVLPYIAAQLLGAMFGQLVVVAAHRPYYLQTENPNNILGSFVLFFCALGLTKNFFGAEVAGLAQKAATEQGGVFDATSTAAKLALSQAHAPGLGIAHLALGFLVMALVTSLGGPTGPGLNPARDFGPRLVHAFLPKSVLGEHKGDSKWWYAWVPVVAPILAAILAVLLFKVIYLG